MQDGLRPVNVRHDLPEIAELIELCFGDVLDEIKEKMAFMRGGSFALQKALEAKTVCTVQLNSNMQISGILSKYIEYNNSEPCYLQFIGPVQLCRYGNEIPLHGASYHSDGYGTTIGKIKNFNFR